MKPYIDTNGLFLGFINEELVSLASFNTVDTPLPPEQLGELESYRFTSGAWVAVPDSTKGVWIDPLNTSDRFMPAAYDTPVPPIYVHKPVVTQMELDSKARGFVFNPVTRQWEDPRTLDDLKATQWTVIKQSRSNAEYEGFTWESSVFDSDAVSQNRITGAVTLAQMSTTFTVDWILKDNTVRTLNQADMMQVGAALGVHVATIFAKAQALRLVINAAETKEAVEAIAWV